jgi:glutamine synthetase
MASIDHLSVSDLEFRIEKGEVDTILVAFVDAQGRLQGKRVVASHFMSQVMSAGTAIPAHLLAVDTERAQGDGANAPVLGSAFGDLLMRPDVTTLFRMPWQPDSAGVLCDIFLPDGTPVAISPRAVLTRQIARLEASSMAASIGAEPDFLVFQETYEQAFGAGYRNLTPLTMQPGSHSAFASARTEPLLGRIRKALAAVTIPIDYTTAQPAPGQHQVTLHHQTALRACDGVSIVKNAIKEMVAQDGRSVTFMAKYDLASNGNAGAFSLSFRSARGAMTLTDRYDESGLSPMGKAFIAGHTSHARELMLLFAPTPNSYRRFVSEPLAPSAANWGRDNRSCAFRLVGSDLSIHLENRIPGSDANPYLVVAGMIAAGLDGVHRQLPSDPPIAGNGRDAGSPALPTTLAEAIAAWEESAWVEATFGRDVQQHYADVARIEEAASAQDGDDALDQERVRYFEVP